jgi:hypothetical protein
MGSTEGLLPGSISLGLSMVGNPPPPPPPPAPSHYMFPGELGPGTFSIRSGTPTIIIEVLLHFGSTRRLAPGNRDFYF